MLPAPATWRGIFNNNRDFIAVNLSEYQGRSCEMEVLREEKGLKGEKECVEL
jgi:hypothetical protein